MKAPKISFLLPLLVLSGVAVAVEKSPIVPFVIPAGRPDAAEVRRIVESLRRAGCDQFLVYPSTGLDYEYLGEEFFAMVGAFLAEAKARDMNVWLYDEFNWPSGTARGRVPAENDACLYRELVATTNGAGEVSWQVVVSRETNVDNYCLDGNNFESASVNRFMALTHREYERRFRGYFGSTIRGIFSDEPGHCSSAWHMKMPPGTVLRVPYWSTMETDYAAASGGRDFRRDYAAARRTGRLRETDVFRIWTDIRSKRYRATYFDPIRRWCDRMGIVSCGHLVGEGGADGCARINGLPLNTLGGFSKPGIDLIASDTEHGFEWQTLAFAQSAARVRGRPGIAELFGLGPCDLTFTTMRKLYWLCALHRIDTFFQATYHHRAFRFNVKDTWAMFTSPTQPWFSEMPLLHDAARESARWALKPQRCDIAVVYPQRAAGSATFGAGPSMSPRLGDLCGRLTLRQLTYDLIQEDEPTDRAVVIDWKGTALCERRSGRTFKDPAETVAWLDAKFAARPRVTDNEGRTRYGFVTRAYEDGSAVAVDIKSGEVIVAPDGRLSPRKETARFLRPVADRWSLSLSGPSKRRVWFWTKQADAQRKTDSWLKREEKVESVLRYERDNLAKIVLSAPLKGVRFALRHYPADKAFAVSMDGRPLDFPRPCASVDAAYDELYRETEPMDLAAGEHVFELSGGKDGKLFLPVLWMIGEFAETEYGRLDPVPTSVACGSLAERGLGSFAGVVTYRAEATFAAGERLRIDSGGAVTRVRLGGRDLGARGWAPYEWEIPADLVGRPQPLEIDIVTSVRPIFGSANSPDAKLDHALWVRPELADPSPVGLRAAHSAGFSERHPAPFRPGERMAFLGDSITHASKYLAFLQMRLATMWPDNPPYVINCGISGDTAAGVTGSGRIMWDVLPQKPDRVFVMLGMNDVMRDCWKSVEPASPAEAARRERAIAGYESSLRNLARELAARAGPVVLMTPSPYDQYGTFDDKALLACNEPGLSRCAEVVRRLGRELDLPVVELHAPMTALLKRGTYGRLCGNDRVHPGDAGHSILAALVLNACGASSEPFEELAHGLREDVRAPMALRYAKALSEQRRLAEYRKVIVGMGGDVADPKACDALLDRWVEKNRGCSWYEGCRNAAKAFRDLRNRKDELAREFQSARSQLIRQ